MGVLESGWEQQGMAPWDREAPVGAENTKLLEEVTGRTEKCEQSYMLISWWKRLLQEGGTLCSEPTPPPRIWWWGSYSGTFRCANFSAYHHQKEFVCH